MGIEEESGPHSKHNGSKIKTHEPNIDKLNRFLSVLSKTDIDYRMKILTLQKFIDISRMDKED